MSNRNKYLLQSVENSLRVLEAFREEEPELGISELARKLGLSRSSVYRIVATLTARGFLAQETANGKYRLGLGALRVGCVALNLLDVRRQARPYLEELVRDTGETAHLVLLEECYAVFVDKVESTRPFNLTSRLGWRAPAYATATGKCLLAFNSIDDKIAKIAAAGPMRRLTPKTVADPEKLREELKMVRQQGYAMDFEETQEGMVCFGAPIRDRLGRAIAAISLSGPAARMLPRQDDLIARIVSRAASISRSFGCDIT
ncbi:MAG TPA: IclR family transcriptional regulator [Firmicutes bacterium]|jgi:IclR family KDG regulon transcriptional repressor|nr:IclR family transcriptional regulator [Bacillota bacterium]